MLFCFDIDLVGLTSLAEAVVSEEVRKGRLRVRSRDGEGAESERVSCEGTCKARRRGS